MTSGRRTVRLPVPSELHAEPPLGPLLLLELAAAVAANALRAHHIAIEGDFFLDETAEVCDEYDSWPRRRAIPSGAVQLCACGIPDQFRSHRCGGPVDRR